MNNEQLVDQSSERLLRFKNEILPKIVVALGKDPSNFQYEIKVPTENYFISYVYMVDMKFYSNGDKKCEEIKLVVKIPPDNIISRVFKIYALFRNEIFFYENISKNNSNYPKCVFVSEKPINEAVIALENVTQFGYKSLGPKEDFDMKKVLAAIREIGKFHGRGYALKENNPEEFFTIVNKMTPTCFDSDTNQCLIDQVNGVSPRPINYLRSVLNYDPIFCDKMSKVLADAVENIFKDCVKPRNELAVICHGDFTGNNVLFKEKNDGEFQAMLIDFAQVRYSSPAIDISTFLYLSCEDEVRKNFPLIFKVYYDSVLEYLKKEGVQDLKKYSYEAFLNDYKRHALYGAEVAFFFMPVMYLEDKPGLEFILDHISEYIQNIMISGGDQLSKKLAYILLELKDNGCLDHLI